MLNISNMLKYCKEQKKKEKKIIHWPQKVYSIPKTIIWFSLYYYNLFGSRPRNITNLSKGTVVGHTYVPKMAAITFFSVRYILKENKAYYSLIAII